MSFYEFLWVSMSFYEFLWVSMSFYEFHSVSWLSIFVGLSVGQKSPGHSTKAVSLARALRTSVSGVGRGPQGNSESCSTTSVARWPSDPAELQSPKFRGDLEEKLEDFLGVFDGYVGWMLGHASKNSCTIRCTNTWKMLFGQTRRAGKNGCKWM